MFGEIRLKYSFCQSRYLVQLSAHSVQLTGHSVCMSGLIAWTCLDLVFDYLNSLSGYLASRMLSSLVWWYMSGCTDCLSNCVHSLSKYQEFFFFDGRDRNVCIFCFVI